MTLPGPGVSPGFRLAPRGSGFEHYTVAKPEEIGKGDKEKRSQTNSPFFVLPEEQGCLMGAWHFLNPPRRQ